MKNKIFLLFILSVGKAYSANSTTYYDEYEALGRFLQLKTPISEFDICENGITRCNNNGYITYLYVYINNFYYNIIIFIIIIFYIIGSLIYAGN